MCPHAFLQIVWLVLWLSNEHARGGLTRIDPQWSTARRERSASSRNNHTIPGGRGYGSVRSPRYSSRICMVSDHFFIVRVPCILSSRTVLLFRKLDERSPIRSLSKSKSADRPERSSVASVTSIASVESSKHAQQADAPSKAVAAQADEEEDLDFCGLCSQRGHSLENCAKLTNGSGAMQHKPSPSNGSGAQGEQEPCDDCGEVGHRFEDCPYAAEIF